MGAIDRSDYSLVGILPVVPRFDWFDDVAIEVPAQWEALAAFYNYEKELRPLCHDWAVERGRAMWAIHKPWYC